MAERTACRVANAAVGPHGATMTIRFISTKWINEKVKLYALYESNILVGEMPIGNLIQWSQHFKRELGEYVRWMNEILEEKTNGIDFLLEDGQLMCVDNISKGFERSSIIVIFRVAEATREESVQFAEDVMISSFNSEREVGRWGGENEMLEKEFSEMKETLEDAKRIQNQMEYDLYRRFATVLNREKAKMRELDATLEKMTVNPVFDKSTNEESE